MILFIVRHLLILLWMIVCLLISFLHCLIWPMSTAPIYTFLALWGPLSAKILGLEYEMRHHERLTQHRPCVMIGNHQSNYDLLLAGLYRVPHAVSLGKRELIWIPFFGLWYWLTGNIMVNRGNKKQAKASMDKVRDRIRRKKLSVLIMPEGTRSKGRGLLPFKRGAFLTAIHAGVPIAPLVISDWDRFIDLRRWRSGKVIIEALPPVDTSGYQESQAEALSNHCRQLMIAKIDEINRELASQETTPSQTCC